MSATLQNLFSQSSLSPLKYFTIEKALGLILFYIHLVDHLLLPRWESIIPNSKLITKNVDIISPKMLEPLKLKTK